MELKEDDLVLCKVVKIENAAVFVELESGEKGSIAMSEIAAGRIRNLREYVVLNKKIVCKILKKQGDHLELSLRRVTGGERDEVLEKYKKERTSSALLKAVLKDHEKTTKLILKDMPLSDFVSKSRENIKIASEYLTKDELSSLERVLAEKKDKEKSAKSIILIKSNSSSGLNDIKEILSEKKVSVSYLGSGKFSISANGSDFKEANHKVSSTIEKMQKMAKDKKAIFEIISEEK